MEKRFAQDQVIETSHVSSPAPAKDFFQFDNISSNFFHKPIWKKNQIISCREYINQRNVNLN